MDIHPSSYNIYIPLEHAQEYDFLIHGYTGAIDVVRKQVVKNLRSGSLTRISEETCSELVKRGYLTTKSIEEEREFVSVIARKLSGPDKKTAAFVFIVTYDCNLRCTYCYENRISDSGNSWCKSVFTKEMTDKAFDSMDKILKDYKRHDVITLYGGEPLLAANYDIVSYIINKGSERGYKFFVVTNGYDLDHFEDLLSDDKIYGIQVTIDGTPETHNKRRPHFLYDNSFDKIVENIKLALKKNVQVALRINTDNSNYQDIPELLSLLKEHGLSDSPLFKVYSSLTQQFNSCYAEMNPGQDPEKMDRVLFTNELLGLKDKYNLDNLNCQDHGVHTMLAEAVRTKKNIRFRSVYCGAHNGMHVFDPVGDIYTCWEIVQQHEHIVGSFKNGLEYYPGTLNKWRSRNIMNMDSCRVCKFALLCGGGCIGEQLLTGKSINMNSCDSFPKVLSIVTNNFFDKSLKDQFV